MQIIEKENNWIQTYTNTRFSYTEPSTDNINIVDIAHALSMIPRFCGHGKFHYTVAQHSLTVCALMRADKLSKEIALAGLLHDAHEAYIGDIPTPLKLHIQKQFGIDIKDIEAPIIRAIEDKFEIDLTSDKVKDKIEYYDSACLRTEAESLFDKVLDDWTGKIQIKLKNRVKNILTPMEAKHVFIGTFKRLNGEGNVK